MKRILFIVVGICFLTACSIKTNEEKARELIETQIKVNLIKPESYEFAKIQLDSCFSDSRQNPEFIAFALEVVKLFNEYKNYTSDAESAESSMTIYAPSYGYQHAHDKQQYKKYKAEMEKARRRAADAKAQIIQLYKDNKDLLMAFQSDKHEFIGWMAIISYRAETAGGIKTMDEGLFYLNKDLTKVTDCFTEGDLMNLQLEDLDDLKYEFEKEFKEIFENNQSSK